jgi:hypothetical protein
VREIYAILLSRVKKSLYHAKKMRVKTNLPPINLEMPKEPRGRYENALRATLVNKNTVPILVIDFF